MLLQHQQFENIRMSQLKKLLEEQRNISNNKQTNKSIENIDQMFTSYPSFIKNNLTFQQISNQNSLTLQKQQSAKKDNYEELCLISCHYSNPKQQNLVQKVEILPKISLTTSLNQKRQIKLLQLSSIRKIKSGQTQKSPNISDQTIQSLSSSQNQVVSKQNNCTDKGQKLIDSYTFSQESDEMIQQQNKKNTRGTRCLTQNQCEDISSNQQNFYNCQTCQSLNSKNQLLQNELEQILKINKSLKQINQKNKKMQLDQIKQENIKQIFLDIIPKITKLTSKITNMVNSAYISISISQKRNLHLFSSSWSQFQTAIDIKKLTSISKKINHDKCKKIIQELLKKYKQKQQKLMNDFKKFVNNLQPSKLKIQFKQTQKIVNNKSKPKKVRFSYETSSPQTTQVVQDRTIQKRKYDALKQSYQRQVQKNKDLIARQKFLTAKYYQQTNTLILQRRKIQRYVQKKQKQFSTFIQKLASNGQELTVDTFFGEVCKRLYEISNMIPFDENDDQLLFVPQTKQQVFEMLQRIRSFYYQYSKYIEKKQKQLSQNKKNVLALFKNLIQIQKVNYVSILDFIKQNKNQCLDYIKELVVSMRESKKRQLKKNNYAFTQPTRLSNSVPVLKQVEFQQ